MVVCKEEIEKLKKMERSERGLIMMPYYVNVCLRILLGSWGMLGTLVGCQYKVPNVVGTKSIVSI